MKTTVDLPDALVREIKLRAVHEGRKLKEAMADLLRKGLNSESPSASQPNGLVLVRNERTGLPLVKCKHPAPNSMELTPDRVAEILLEQEVSWHHEAGR
jgi:hypothetical protein